MHELEQHCEQTASPSLVSSTPARRTRAPPTAAATFLGPCGRWPHERKVALESLLEQGRARGAINRSLSLGHRFVFDQRVALGAGGRGRDEHHAYTGARMGAGAARTLTYPVLRSRLRCRFLISP